MNCISIKLLFKRKIWKKVGFLGLLKLLKHKVLKKQRYDRLSLQTKMFYEELDKILAKLPKEFWVTGSPNNN